MKLYYFVSLTSMLFLSASFFAQDGKIDSSFNVRPFHKRIKPHAAINWTVEVNTIKKQVDDKLIVAGRFESFEPYHENICRINPDKSIDTTFLAGVSIDNYIYDLCIQPDQKIIVVGRFTNFDGTFSRGIIRLMPDGTIDPLFSIGQGAQFTNNSSAWITKIALQPDGKIILSGNFDKFNNINRPRTVRLNTDGTVDLSFNPNFDAYYLYSFGAGDIEVLPDNRIAYIGGISLVPVYTGTTAGQYNNMVILNPDGSLDTSFKTLYSAQLGGNIGKQGDYFIVGQNGLNFHRIDSVGNFDPSFTPYYWGTSYIRDILVLSDNSMYVLLADKAIKLSPNGGFIHEADLNSWTISTGFGGASMRKIIETHNGFAYGGEFEEPYNKYHMSNGIGHLDQNGVAHEIIPGLGLRDGNSGTALLYDMAVTSSDKILIAGNFRNYDNIDVNGFARLMPNGLIDTSFYSVLGPQNSSVKAVEVLTDGSIIILGDFSSFNGIPAQKIAKLNPDGTNIPGFFSNYSVYENSLGFLKTEQIRQHENGKILMTLSTVSDQLNSISRNLLVAFNPDGSLDTTLNLNTTSAGNTDYFTNGAGIFDFDFDSDSTIIVGGHFVHRAQDTINNISRIFWNGKMDTTFVQGLGFKNNGLYSNAGIQSIEVQPDGKILVGGDFDEYNGYSTNALIRLNSDGSRDTTFDIGSGVEWGNLNDILLQPDGRILIFGSFLTYNGVSMSHSAIRLLSNGNIDSTFSGAEFLDMMSGSGLPAPNILCSEFQSDGKLIVGGYGKTDLTQVYYQAPPGVYRLSNDTYTPPLNLNFSVVTPPSCSSSGIAQITPTFGVAPYLYSWNNSSFSINPQIPFSSPGFYEAFIQDSTGFQEASTVYLDGPILSPNHDLEANLITNSFRPGFNTDIFIMGHNNTCAPATGQIKLALPSTIAATTVTPAPDQIIGDTLMWNFTDLTYDSSEVQIYLNLSVPTSYQIGDSVPIDLFITPILGDSDSSNNTRNYEFPIINGYDPNDKKVYPVGDCIPHYIDTNQVLTYTVRFQNTGNSQAINILLVDDFDADLDPSTFRLVSSSHPVITELQGISQLNFEFNNINLPDSLSDPIGSQGFVVFEVKPFATAPFNQEIENSAEIYFDFNPPIITNTVLNTVSDGSYQNSSTSLTLTNCDSLVWNNQILTSSGVYTESLSNVYGCDSTATLNLTVNNSYSNATDTILICEGDSILLFGQYQSNLGFYSDTIQTSSGCDSVLNVELIASLPPQVNIDSSIEDTVCHLSGLITFTNSTPPGGTYSGTGVGGNQFNPNVASPGTHVVYYTFVDAIGCPASDSLIITVESCASLEEQLMDQISISPNPSDGKFALTFTDQNTGIVQIHDALGKLIENREFSSEQHLFFELKGNPGIYFIMIDFESGTSLTLRIAKM